MSKAEPVLCLAGPTASGKTAAAMALAAALAQHGRTLEIISVDSALVYRGMDIGTAKPTHAELAQVRHHLIDIIEPTEAYSAAQFALDVSRLVGEIRGRGAVPLLVGGTMLYFKALFDGLAEMPAAHAETRAQLEREAAERGWPALHADLAQVDPATAKRLAPGDSQRISRALEVWRVSGRTLSAWHATKKVAVDARSVMAYRLISLEPQARAWLHARIAQRFDAMLAAGLLSEVEALRARGDLTADLPSMRCVGYRQTWEALDGAFPMAELRERGIAATRQLAKRQLTWMRSFEKRSVIACDVPDAVHQVLALAGDLP